MCSELGRPFEWGAHRNDIVVVYVYVYVYLDEIVSKAGDCRLERSKGMVIITARDQPMGLVYIVGFKINHRQ